MYTDTLEFDVYQLSTRSHAACAVGPWAASRTTWYTTVAADAGDGANPTPTTLWCDWSGMAFSTDGGAPDAAVPGVPDAGTALDGGMSMTASAPRST